MLRMSKMTDYGIVLMTRLAAASKGQHTAADLSAQVEMPLPTVSKILKQLARAQLLVSSRGAQGGYSLARPPETISVAEIITTLEGPIGLTECISTPGECGQESHCSTRVHWERINQAVYGALNEIKLSDMVQPMGVYPIQFHQLTRRSVPLSTGNTTR
ncbi:SUF system Fe-S cluster assembly regulator [Nitrosococcus wardiae]|uniref:SUF system Fe-S cluster assembly regulator n=1 Tax=Nitrosococcus wardiae TaxID=1814290 RepID=A0A4P7BVK6_9GAMM|nr:SUF system Fe-S cluster assembly regulator [Nitrosococcus wardiae]QBQ53209.1 SUF system Fe-S cluster assembly regulator [Nitrosococcus wardiae]